jgi:HD-GYP domain-containing protein (c-di-GMP phosphodiesterase class II)
MLLDVGKLRLPAELLSKKTALTGEEHRLMKSHVELGVQILQSTPGIPEEVVAMVATHHEREDGSGYPKGLGGDEISLLGKIAGIVDTFEDLTTTRFLVPAASPQEALQILHNGRVRLFEAWLVDRFTHFMGLYPAGSLVELTTGEVAVTLASKPGAEGGPTVLLVLDPQKKPYPLRSVVNLGAPPAGAPAREIARGLESGTHGINPSLCLRDAVERLAAAQRALG